jgi:hypothetical protein
MDILIDKKLNAWLMEVNSNPSLNMFLEKDDSLLPSQGGTKPPGEMYAMEPHRELSELDKYVKVRVITEAIRIVTGEGVDEYDGTFE